MQVLRSLVITLAAGMALAGCGGSSNSSDEPITQNPPKSVTLNFLGRFTTGQFDVGASGPLAWYGGTKHLFVTNKHSNRIDVLSLTTPASPVQIASIDASADAANALVRAMGKVTAVATYDDPDTSKDRDRIAVTVLGEGIADNGAVVVYKAADRSLVTVLATGVGPGSVAFSQDGRFIVTADEGEPAPDYSIDPEGSISVVDLTPTPVAPATSAPPSITTLGFQEFNVTGISPVPATSREAEIGANVRFIAKPAPLPVATRSQDLEPEFVTTALNSRAYVSLQENNAFATVALSPPRIETILGFGSKDFSTTANTLDASDANAAGVLSARPVRGYYQPGAIAAYRNINEVLLLTANTGAPRVLPAFDERVRASSLVLDSTVFPDAANLQQDANIGRLHVSAIDGNVPATDTVPADPDLETIFTFGARSFSIFRPAGALVVDSGNDFERITLEQLGNNFNSETNANNTGDLRSDDMGPAPSALALGQIEGATFVFIGLSEVGGIMVYALDNELLNPRFITYKTERNFTVHTTTADANEDGVADSNPAAGDLGPNSIVFIPVSSSPTTDSLLVVANSVSGSTSIYAVQPVTPP